jgi:hypothetical protein
VSSTGPARIFVECRAGRPSASLFATGSSDAFESYVQDVSGKLCQLDRCIRDHIDGGFVIPNDLAGSNDAYIPMLVLDEPFQWTFAFKLIVDRLVAQKRWFRHPRVSAPIICGIDDLDALVGSCERGDDLPSILRQHLMSDRKDPLDMTIQDRSGLLRPSA